MSVLIAKLSSIVFRCEESGCVWFKSVVGGKSMMIEFSLNTCEIPKPLKTVDYKLIGEYKRMSNGGKKFVVSRFEKAGKVGLLSSKIRQID